MTDNEKTGAAERKMPAKEFLPLMCVTCAAFIFNTSEFMPIGLLTDIAADFKMTEAGAGGKPFSIGKLPALFETPALSGIFVLTLAISCAYYTVYSYIEPFLLQTAKLPDHWVTIALSVFGASAVAMSIFSGIFNMGIALGTMLGGAVCTRFSIADIGFAGAAIALPAAFACVAVTRKANAARS